MEDLKEIKQDVKELLQRSAVHNQILSEHKAYSIALQKEQAVINERIKPIEKHVAIVAACLKIAGMVLAGVLVQALIRHFFAT